MNITFRVPKRPEEAPFEAMFRDEVESNRATSVDEIILRNIDPHALVSMVPAMSTILNKSRIFRITNAPISFKLFWGNHLFCINLYARFISPKKRGERCALNS